MSLCRPTVRRVAIAIGVVSAVLLSGLLFRAAIWRSEPRFEGKSLSYWLDQLESIDIGPNGRRHVRQFRSGVIVGDLYHQQYKPVGGGQRPTREYYVGQRCDQTDGG